MGSLPLLKIVVLVLLLLLFLYAFYWVFGRFIGVIRWALNRIAYALGNNSVQCSRGIGVFASAGPGRSRGNLDDGEHQHRLALSQRELREPSSL
jgi:hypothetical protein